MKIFDCYDECVALIKRQGWIRTDEYVDVIKKNLNDDETFDDVNILDLEEQLYNHLASKFNYIDTGDGEDIYFVDTKESAVREFLRIVGGEIAPKNDCWLTYVKTEYPFSRQLRYFLNEEDN